MNIRQRLTLRYTVVLSVMLLIFSTLLYFGLSQSLQKTVDEDLKTEAEQIANAIAHDYDEGEYELEHVPQEEDYWRVLNSQGQPVISSRSLPNIPLDPLVIQSNQTTCEFVTLSNDALVRFCTVPFIINQQQVGAIQIGSDYQEILRIQQQLLFLITGGMLFTLLVAAAAGWFLAAQALAPIDRITRTAQQISAADLHQRLNLELPDDEVGRLANTFDLMLARLEDTFERQKRFIADASHEMRTPLTVLKGDVEVTLNRPRSAEQYRQTLEMVNQTTDGLTALVQELFLLARVDNDQYPLQRQPLNLAQLLTDTIADLMPTAIKKEVTLHLNTPDDLPFAGDSAKLTRIFVNLIDNALKYSQSGTAVNIKAATQNNQIWITIADTGPGIAPEHLPHLFDRFYRVDKARSHQVADTGSSGAGLGLSIVQSLVHIHGGHIDVTSQVGQGTTFTLCLPQN